MGKLDEFIAGLQTILDSPNPPRNELIGVIQSTQREFLDSALAVSTITWPTRTHLELVKIVISLPVPEPSLDVVMANPGISHEADPFFGADYFEKLRQQLLSMPIQTLAAGDGSWIKNIGFSIEATVMQASRRADSLERMEELSKADEARTGQDLSRVRVYCAHVLGQGTLASKHWEAIARTMFTIFYILPFSTQTMGVQVADRSAQSSNGLDLHVAQLIMHYGSWLQIVMQMIENHGPALCRRMPTVIEDPDTRQFKWGVPAPHSVAATELLRNFIMRRIFLRQATEYVPDSGSAGASESVDPSTVAWTSNPDKILAEEQRLEQLEQNILGQIIAKDASAVYGMMSEQHHLLQILDRLSHEYEPIVVAPELYGCLMTSLSRTCYGLAPILGFEESALSSAMDMDKLFQCLDEMKKAALNMCYLPLYGCYPPGTSSIPEYAEKLTLRIATTLYNIEQPWGEPAHRLAPDRIPGIAMLLAHRLVKVLRVTAVYFDIFSLNTARPLVAALTEFRLQMPNTAWLRLMECRYARSTYPECLGSVVRGYSPQEITRANQDSMLALGLVGICEFISYAEAFVPSEALYTCLKAAIDAHVEPFVRKLGVSTLLECLKRIQTIEWRALASTRLKASSRSSDCCTTTLFSIIWACAHRVQQQHGSTPSPIDVEQWQVTLGLCCPESVYLAYLVWVQCREAAKALVHPDGSGNWVVVLNEQGIDSLAGLELALSENGCKAWGMTGGLLFSPAIYSGHEAGAAVAKYLQTQFLDAVHILNTSSPFSWAQKLGLPETAPPFAEDDMRQVGNMITYYLENVPSFFPLLTAREAGASAAPEAKDAAASSSAQHASNPFATPNILSKLTSSEPTSHADSCDVKAAVLQWRRSVARLSYSDSRKHVQSLIAECYPSSSKHYLDQVIVQFISEEPVVGVELVIGSIADHMWRNQVVYSRRSSPFYAIRNMFSPTKRTVSDSGAKDIYTDSTAIELAHSKHEPVFNAVVGGRVRPYPQTREGLEPVDSPSGDKAAAKTQKSAHHQSGAESESHSSNYADGEEVVRYPLACHRLLLLLTALRYGNSLSDTPIYSWLTDCLDHAPQSLLKTYFESLLCTSAPVLSSDLPVEPDWRKKAAAFVSMWMRDSRLRSKPLTMAAAASILCNAFQSGDEWAMVWSEWSHIAKDTVRDLFTKKQTTPLHAEVIGAMLKVPVGGAGGHAPGESLALLKAHPIWLLVDLLTPASERNKLTFADNRDWFIVHALPHILDTMADSTNARDVLRLVISSAECLYQVVPWFDIATTLVQNVPLSNGCPVAMSASVAKHHFVSYLSPLTRLLLSTVSYTEGGPSTAGTATSSGMDVDTGEADGDQSTPKLAAGSGSPSLTEGVSEAAGSSERSFDWQWIDQCLVLYLSGSSNSPETTDDTIDALLDVYTYSSTLGLRQSIENVIIASCLHNPSLVHVVLRRVFSKRPLDIFTLHSLRPKTLSPLPPLALTAADSEPAFRPGAELFPLVKRLLLLAIEGSPAMSATECAREATALIESCMWSIAEEPDVRRNLIALKPRLIPKEQRPAATATGVSHEAVASTTSGGLHIRAEAIASAAAYALDRCVYLLGLLAVEAKENAGGIKALCLDLAHSRVLLATLLTAVGDSMRQFATLPTTRELLNALWAVSDSGDAELGGMKTSQVWAGVNFLVLAQRLNNQMPEEYTSWATVQSLPSK